MITLTYTIMYDKGSDMRFYAQLLSQCWGHHCWDMYRVRKRTIMVKRMGMKDKSSTMAYIPSEEITRTARVSLADKKNLTSHYPVAPTIREEYNICHVMFSFVVCWPSLKKKPSNCSLSHFATPGTLLFFGTKLAESCNDI